MTPNTAAKRTIGVFLVALGALLAGVIGFNAWIDPYGMVHATPSSWKGSLRLCSYEQRRTVKALQIAHGHWDGLVIGSSREEWGVDPTRGIFPEAKVYNAGLPGASADEYIALVRYALEHQDLKYVLIDMDPMAFGRSRLGGAASRCLVFAICSW